MYFIIILKNKMGVDNIETAGRLSERDRVIRESKAKEKKLEIDIRRHDTYKKLNFHYDVADIPADGSSLIKRLKEKFKDDDSREWALLNNPQIQNMLGNILGEHVREWNKKKAERSKQEELQQQKTWEEKKEEEEVESWEDFKERESSPENFEEFLLSDEWIRILIDEIDKHLDDDGKINKNYPIYEKDLKLKLKISWYSIMQREYNEKNGNTTSIEMQEIKQMWNIVADGIDNAVWKYLKAWWNAFDEWMVRELEALLNSEENKEIIKKMEKDPKLKDDFYLALKESIKKYADYVVDGDKLSLNTWTKQMDLQIRSYLFMFWKFFHPWLFKTNQWSQYYEKILPDIMEAILVTDGDIKLKNMEKNNIFLEKQKKYEEERKKQDKIRRQEIARKNREANNNYHSDDNWNGRRFYDSDNISGDINWATWAQIVKKSDVNLSDFKVNSWGMEMYTNSWYAKQKAFWIAWENFKESNEEIEDIITPDQMSWLYIVEWNNISFDEDARKEFLKTDIMQWRSQEEINRIYNLLKTFPNNYSDALKVIASRAQRQEKWMDNETRNHALWSVIDNVRFVFADIVEKWKWDSKFEWFKFDWSEPVEREWNDIIISGTFNWTPIKIRYDLISWGLFMNSFLQHPTNSKISIWNNSSANLQIWQLESFDTILEDHYRAPDISLHSNAPQNRWNHNISFSQQNQWLEQWGDLWENDWEDPKKINDKWRLHFVARNFIWRNIHREEPAPAEPVASEVPVDNSTSSQSSFKPYTSEISSQNNGEIEAIRKKYRDMLYANLDMISNSIIDNTKKQSARNTTITKFMKTFNIMLDGQEDKSIDFNDWSNLFDLLQIIENSDPATLEKFQTFMEKVSDYSGLNRWSNNILGSQRNSKYNITFNENNKNKYISMVRGNAKNFNKNPEIFRGKLNFESDSKLWFAQMIIENITNNVSKPNWELDSSKMDDFIEHLENDGKDS